jgi:hypothetical protein
MDSKRLSFATNLLNYCIKYGSNKIIANIQKILFESNFGIENCKSEGKDKIAEM